MERRNCDICKKVYRFNHLSLCSMCLQSQCDQCTENTNSVSSHYEGFPTWVCEQCLEQSVECKSCEERYYTVDMIECSECVELLCKRCWELRSLSVALGQREMIKKSDLCHFCFRTLFSIS